MMEKYLSLLFSLYFPSGKASCLEVEYLFCGESSRNAYQIDQVRLAHYDYSLFDDVFRALHFLNHFYFHRDSISQQCSNHGSLKLYSQQSVNHDQVRYATCGVTVGSPAQLSRQLHSSSSITPVPILITIRISLDFRLSNSLSQVKSLRFEVILHQNLYISMFFNLQNIMFENKCKKQSSEISQVFFFHFRQKNIIFCFTIQKRLIYVL